MEHPEPTVALDLPEGATKPVSVGGSISGSQASFVGSNGMFNSYISIRVYCEADFTLLYHYDCFPINKENLIYSA